MLRTVDGTPKQLALGSGLGLRQWWPFPHSFKDVAGNNDLSIAGLASNDPIFTVEYPP